MSAWRTAGAAGDKPPPYGFGVLLLVAGCTTPASQSGPAPSASLAASTASAAPSISPSAAAAARALSDEQIHAVTPEAEKAVRAAIDKAGKPPAGQRLEAKVGKFELDPSCKEPRVTCAVTVSLVKASNGNMVRSLVEHASRESTPDAIAADKNACVAEAAEAGAKDLLATPARRK